MLLEIRFLYNYKIHSSRWQNQIELIFQFRIKQSWTALSQQCINIRHNLNNHTKTAIQVFPFGHYTSTHSIHCEALDSIAKASPIILWLSEIEVCGFFYSFKNFFE